MKINLKQALRSFEGEVLKKPVQTEKKDKRGQPVIERRDMTLGTVCIDSLQAIYQDEKNLEAEEKMRRFVLAEEIYLADEEMDIKDDQVVLLKKVIDKAFPSMLVVGQAYRMLEGKGPLKKK